MKNRILVTGANGFVGRHLCVRLKRDGWRVLEAVRRSAGSPVPDGAEQFATGDLERNVDWGPALADVDRVVHLAARVHVMRDDAADPLQEFRRINVEATCTLARQAADAGVKRFVFLSSIKVNGEGTTAGRPYSADDVPAPLDPYGVSKHEAEVALQVIARETGMELVIIRPVLVYGPGVKGNFRELMKWLAIGIPLPLGSITNRRSLVYVGNLVDFIAACLQNPQAGNQVFMVSDGVDFSTPELLSMMASAMGKPRRLIPVPARGLCWLGRLMGRSGAIKRLCGSLQVDIGKNRELLGWTPPVAVDRALKETVTYYQMERDQEKSKI